MLSLVRLKRQSELGMINCTSIYLYRQNFAEAVVGLVCEVVSKKKNWYDLM